MSTNHHTPHQENYELTKVAWNKPLGELDYALTGMVNRTPFTKVLVGSGSLPANQIMGGSTTTQGLRLPRMTTTERNNIATPATGLMIYNTTNGSVDVYNGVSWVALSNQDTVGAIQLLASDDDSNVASVDISSIPATFRDLILVLFLRSRKAASNRDDIYMRFNGDSSAHYQVRGASSEGAADYGTTRPNPGVSQNQIELDGIPAANSNSECYSTWILTIPHYSRSAAGAAGWYYEMARLVPENILRTAIGRFQWHTTSTIINQITLAPAGANNFDCKYYLYGRGEI